MFIEILAQVYGVKWFSHGHWIKKLWNIFTLHAYVISN